MTFENISLLVPFKSDGGIRQKNWDWLKKRYEAIMPEVEICIGDSEDIPYSRAQAINAAARIATRKIYVIVDADVIFNAIHIELAVKMLEVFPWVIPYTHMVKLTQEMSEGLLNQDSNIEIEDLDTSACEVLSYYPMGGICVLSGELFKESGGFDRRFRGWGGEDDAFQRLLDWQYGGHGRPNNVKLYHLYHPKQPIIEAYHSGNRALLFQEGYASFEQVKKTSEYLKRLNGFE